MKRNPEATCETCPYGVHERVDEYGMPCDDFRCRRYPRPLARYRADYCGEHPDFFAAPEAPDEDGEAYWRSIGVLPDTPDTP